MSQRNVSALLLVSLFGCSTGDGNGDDASVDHVNDTSSTLDAPNDANDASASDATADVAVDAGCSDDGACTAVTTLHPPKVDAGASSIFCPRSAPDGGKAVFCTPGSEHCCESSQGACVPSQTACATGDVDWGCADPVFDCQQNQVCCGRGVFLPSVDAGCGSTASCFTGTYCAASCLTGEIVMCTSDAECTNSTTCVPFGIDQNQVGACR